MITYPTNNYGKVHLQMTKNKGYARRIARAQVKLSIASILLYICKECIPARAQLFAFLECSINLSKHKNTNKQPLKRIKMRTCINSIRKLDRLFFLFEANVYNKLDLRTLYNAGTMIRIIKKKK